MSRPSRIGFATAVLLLAGSLPLSAADYFIRHDGDDRANGASPTSAWRTIDRVNHARFHPGDRVQFEGGASFDGSLVIPSADAGTSNSPVVFDSFGDGRATILPGRQSGIAVEGAGGIKIEDLIVAGYGRTNNTGYGIRFDNTLTNGHRLNSITIANVETRGFGILGILVSGIRAGYEHVLITNCVMRDNLRGGMEVSGRLPWDSTDYAHADVRISHCKAFDNSGDPTYLRSHSGSGIVLYQVDGALMEYCQAWGNGGLCHSSGGGVGLWTCASRRVIIEHCESFGNRTSGGDGGGFDLDGGSVDCVLQYNYSHDNDGPGLMVYSYPYVDYGDRRSIVRFNISENDSRKGTRYAGLWVRTDGKEITGLEIYNNTVLIGPWTGQAALIYAHGVEACLRNNIFIATSPAVPLRVEQPGEKVRLENNLYWREGGPTEVSWGSKTYANLDEWRNGTGQECLRGQPTGMFADPFLRRHAASAQPGDVRGSDEASAFCPLPRSPVLAKGLDLRKFGLDTGSRDFLGLLPSTGQFPIGAIGKPAVE